MGKTDTLTAYQCTFNYLKRNNPLMDKQREAIKMGDPPQYTVSEFIEDYIAFASKLAIGETTNRAIQFSSSDCSKEEIENGVFRWRLTPRAGKQGKPITVMKTSTMKQYNFASDAAALYGHNIFIYEHNESIFAIFHRQNGSGCKSIFMEIANKMLKEKGLKLEMVICVPLSDILPPVIPTKITLQCVRKVTSSDLADNCRRKTKPVVVRDLGLNLEVQDNKRISRHIAAIFDSMKLGQIDSDTAFAKIKAECSDSIEYNDAEVQVRIGQNSKTVPWNKVEQCLGSYDITKELYTEYSKTKDFVGALTGLADKYYGMISGEEDN